jgi:hypothetical protein
VGDYRSSRPDGTSFSCIVANSDDEVEFDILEFFHGLAAGIRGIYLEVVLKDRQGHRMRCGLGIDAGAVYLETILAYLAK